MADAIGEWKGEFVGQAGCEIRFVADDRNASQPCSPDDGWGDESAFAEHDVGFDTAEKEERFDESEKNAEKICEILPVDIATEFSCGNSVIRDVFTRDEFAFDTVAGADVMNGVPGITQGRQERDVWGYVTSGASASEDDGGQKWLPLITW